MSTRTANRLSADDALRLAAIAARARTLDECLRATLNDAPRDVDPRAELRLQTWMTVLDTDTEGLDRRLSWDGIDRTRALRALIPVTDISADEQQLPRWLRLLWACYRRRSVAHDDRTFDAERPVAFEGLYIPILREARRRLRRSAGDAYQLLDDAAHVTLERALLRRLVEINGRALYAEFSALRALQPPLFMLAGGDSLYREFIASLQRGRVWAYFHSYPVAARLTGVVTTLWIQTVREFLLRLRTDRERLSEVFADGRPLGSVVSIRGELSDPHCGGRSVLIPQFEDGTRIVYKPRAVGLDDLYAHMLEWLNRNGAAPPLRALTVLARGDYGWIEFAEARTCDSEDEVRRFYERCGAVIALAYALNGSDFHMENLIAAGEHPVLIDMEALVGHRFRLDGLTAREAGSSNSAIEWFEKSVLKLGLLPMLKLEKRGYAVDIAGIGGMVDSEESVRAPFWHAVNTDAMRIGFRDVHPRMRSNNQVQLGGVSVEPGGYVSEIVRGFRHTYTILLERGHEMRATLRSSMVGAPVRFIFRNTSLYAALLQRTLHPNYLRDGVDRSLQLDVLAKPLLRLSARPAVWPVLSAEHRALERMDAPLFAAAANARGLRLEDSTRVRACFERSAAAEVETRLRSFSASDLDAQTRLIGGSFQANVARRMHAPMPRAETLGERAPLVASEAIGMATQIARTLRAQAVAHEGGAAWITARYLPAFRRYRLDLSDYTLYDGSGGIALFLAALEHVAPANGVRDLALAALGALRQRITAAERLSALQRDDVDIGIATGTSSAIYTLVRAARFLDMPELIDDACAVASLITPELLQRDRASDLASGAAGALVALLVLYDETGDDAHLAHAQSVGRQLLSARIADETGRLVWATWMGRPEYGFAHGQAGIAYALRRLATALGSVGDEFACAAAGAIAHERELLGHDFAAAVASEPSSAWGYGATGIALGRLATPGPIDETTRAEIDAAVHLANEHLCHGGDTLACGRMARLELLHYTGGRLGRPDLNERALRYAHANDECTAAAYDTGWGANYQDLGFMQGLAGIGYQLLRLTHKDRLPAILVFE